MISEYRVIDADGHILEPPDMWVRYSDPGFQDRMPRVRMDPDGLERMYVEDLVLGGKTGVRLLGALGHTGPMENYTKPYAEGAPGGFFPRERLKVLDGEGIDAAFLYPSLGLHLGGVKDGQLSAAICRAYNRWLAEYCSVAPDRLFAVAMLPMQSVELAIQEMRYARKELGIRGGFLRPNPYKGRQLHHRDYDPFWAEAQDMDFCVGLHEGADGGMPVVGVDRFENAGIRHIISHSMEMMLAALSVIMCGVCARFPGVRIGFLESGGGWMAGWLDRMDRHWGDGNNSVRYPELKLPPSQYFQRQCWISFEPVEGSLAYLADYIGPHKILWATDFPHLDGYIGAPQMIRQMPRLSEENKRRILFEGAMGFYKLSQPGGTHSKASAAGAKGKRQSA